MARARRNMALRTTIGGQQFEFDTPQEMAEFLRLMKGMETPQAVIQAPPAQQAGFRDESKTIARPAGRPKREILVGEGAITTNQAVLLSRALGGLRNFCPDADARIAAAGGSAEVMVEVWGEMGVDKPKASELIGILKSKDLTSNFPQTVKSKIAQVVEILASHGVVCTTSGSASWMKNNARRNSANRNSLWLRAY